VRGGLIGKDLSQRRRGAKAQRGCLGHYRVTFKIFVFYIIYLV